MGLQMENLCIICERVVYAPEKSAGTGIKFLVGEKEYFLHHQCLIALQIALIYGHCDKPEIENEGVVN